MQESYWSKFASGRIGRRRALGVTGGAAAAAAFLAACGGDDEDSGGGTGGGTTGGSTGGTTGGGTPSGGAPGGDTSGLLTKPVHIPPAQAKRGGVFKDWSVSEPRNLDPITAQAGLVDNTEMVYNTLITEKPGLLKPSAYELEGSLAQSWEIRPDGLQITFKMRPNVKWHNIAPVNGRAFDSSDVVAAMNRHAEKSGLRTIIWNSAAPDAPTLAPTAPDASTVLVGLTDPVAYQINYFAPYGGFTATMVMTPRETDDTFDINQGMIGTGPFYLSRHEPSVTFEYKRNPDFWDPDHALVDEIQMPIVPEYIARTAQLQAGEIYPAWDYNNGLRPTDVLSVKKDQPKLQLYEGPFNLSTSVLTFGTQGANPYKDERVRQAISMAIDRDLDIEVRNNVSEFVDAGIPIRTVWNSHLAARDEFEAGGWWLDPQGSDFGPNAKYFQYDIPEAKKLLAAAGFPDGFEVPFHYPNSPQFNRASVVEPFFFYLQEIGLTINQNGQTDYTQDYIPLNRDASGAYEGIAYHSVAGTVPSVVSPTSALVAEHLPLSGIPFHGYSADGGTGKTGDPALVEILTKARTEQNVQTRKSLVLEAQRYLGKAMWSLAEPGGSTGIYAAWPAVQNFRVWSSASSSWKLYQVWLDQTKAPFA